jgi:hypothetical protein
VQLLPFSRHLIPLRSKYSSQNPVLKHLLENNVLELSLYIFTVVILLSASRKEVLLEFC